MLSQLSQNGYVEEALFQQLQINQEMDKYLKQIMEGDAAFAGSTPAKFTGFCLSEALYQSL